MHLGQRIHRKAYRFRRFRTHVAHAVPLDEGRHFLFERLRRRGRLEPQKGRKRGAAPMVPVFRAPGAGQLDQHRELPLGRCWQVTENAGDAILLGRVARGGDRHRLADRIGGAEIFARLAFAEQQASRRCECLPPVALYHRDIEHIEEGRIGLRQILARRDAVAQHAAAVRATGVARADDIGEIPLQFIEQTAHCLGRRTIIFAAPQVPHGLDQVDFVMVRQPLLKARLEPDVEAQHQEHGDAHGKAADVECGIQLVPG